MGSEKLAAASLSHRVGHGQDAHALVVGEPLVIGGVLIPSPRGADAHSDGDVLLHALADALLSAYALGDIGQHFPPSDPTFKGLASSAIVEHALQLVKSTDDAAQLLNLSAVITLDTPKLGGRRADVQAAVASLVGLDQGSVGITFKTSEGLAPDHVQASVIVLLRTTL